jgi:hypothetical protein
MAKSSEPLNKNRAMTGGDVQAAIDTAKNQIRAILVPVLESIDREHGVGMLSYVVELAKDYMTDTELQVLSSRCSPDSPTRSQTGPCTDGAV